MNPGVTVVICCHNSAQRISETLKCLLRQELRHEIPWEVLIIENASTDQTADVVRHCWTPEAPVPLRVVSEPNLGIANARFRSFSEAKYDIISFVDDDNRVGPDWIQNVSDFFASHPEAGAVGGPSRPAFEAAPPSWFSNISGYYAVGDQHAFNGNISSELGTLLWTAGMSLRKEKVHEIIDRGFRFLACGGSSLALKTGEDTELCFALRASGVPLYYDASLAIDHFMPADRLTWRKALRLLRTMGASSVLFEIYLIALEKAPYKDRSPWRKSWLFYVLKALQRVLHLSLTHPMDCWHKPEGSMAALEMEKEKGRLTTLWSMRGRYRSLIDTLAGSDWNRQQQVKLAI